jgi:uncharacterized repeat protein (TIGR01451 family)/uncharacterized protein (TIGR03382 family)
MGICNSALRASTAAFVLAGALAARAVLPVQSADLRLVGAFTATVPPTKLDFGKTLGYTFTLTNLGPGHATGVQLDAPTIPAGTTVTAVTGATCSADATTGNLVFPCPISADMLPADPAITDKTKDPGVVTITMTISLDVQKTAPADACTLAALGDLTASVSTDANTTDPTPANNIAIVSGAGVIKQPYTDVGVTISGPDRVNVGSQTAITTTVTNNGPCTALNVGATFIPGNLLQFVSGAAVSTGPSAAGAAACAAVDPTAIDAKGNNASCTIGDMTAGQVVTWTDTYKVKSLPDSVIQTTLPDEVDIATDSNDVNGDNDVATNGTRTGKEAGGCSTGGPAGLAAVALMGLAVRAARRRRVA